MKINIRGDKITVTKAIKDYIEEKLQKLDKYFKKDANIKCNVIIRVKNNIETIEVSIPTSKFYIRAEESNEDLYAAIDLIVDKLERMIRKNKTRLQNHYKSVPSFEMSFEYEEEESKPEKIVKRKNLDIKPMDEDEAMMQMELLNHDFFAFKNINEECVSVLYKRSDGTLGILNVK